MKQFFVLDPTGARDESGKNGFYYPVLYHNTFWQLKTHMVELNSTLPYQRLDMNIQLSTLNNWYFSIMATMDEGMKKPPAKPLAARPNQAAATARNSSSSRKPSSTLTPGS